MIALVALLIAWQSALWAQDQTGATTPPAPSATEQPQPKTESAPSAPADEQKPAPAPAAPQEAKPAEPTPAPTPSTDTRPPEPAAQESKPAEPPSLEAKPVGPAPQEAKPAEPPPPSKPAHIALLLPLNTKTYARAAEAVRDGFLAARQVHEQSNPLPVQIYISEDNAQKLLATYARAIAENAKVIVGPMARNEVNAIAKSAQVSVPTLALGVPESEAGLPQQFYSLNLSQEAEARQVAHIARAGGKAKAITIAADSLLSKRVQAAFSGEWQKQGGSIVRDFVLSRDPKNLQEVRALLKANPTDLVFLALDAVTARKVKPYVGPKLPVYATSQVFRSKNEAIISTDLQGVQFVDMPWLLKPEHATVSAYPQPKQTLSAELQRFYALGVDAFRVSQILLQSERPPALDGVTGRITFGAGQMLYRELTIAVFDATGTVRPLTQ
jgi:uncharacterized protein